MIWSKLFKKEKPLQPLKTSPGKLKSYVQCPKKFSYLYVEKKTGGPVSTVHLAFDGIINRAVESLQKTIFEGFGDIPGDAFLQEIEAKWNPDAFMEGDDQENFYNAAVKSAENMLRWFQEDAGVLIPFRGGPAIGIFAAWYPFPITVNTRLDRIEKSPDGYLRLVDFKSGARQMTSREMMFDLGVRLQAAAAREQFGSDLKKVAQVYLRTGDTIEVDVEDLELGRLENDLRELAQRMQTEGYQPNPGPLCSVCEYVEQCPGWKTLPWDVAGEDRDTFKKRLRLSYSKMSLFERCPRSFSKLYEEKVAPKPQPFFSFGSCIHAVMEDYYDENLKEKRTEPMLMDFLDKRWREYKVGYRSEEEEAQYRVRAVDMLKKYYNQFIHNQKFKPAASIEDYFEIPVGKDTILTGFIDRIDKLDSGGYTVLDYKTEPTERSQESVDKDLQLTMYYWAAGELGYDIQELGLFMMSHDKLITTTRSEKDLPVLMERIEEATRQIRAETEFKPKINKYCMSCDHLVGCPLEEEIRSSKDLRTMEFTKDDK